MSDCVIGGYGEWYDLSPCISFEYLYGLLPAADTVDAD